MKIWYEKTFLKDLAMNTVTPMRDFRSPNCATLAGLTVKVLMTADFELAQGVHTGVLASLVS